MGRALMARLVEGNTPSDYVAPVQLVERASLQTPEIPAHKVPARLRAATR